MIEVNLIKEVGEEAELIQIEKGTVLLDLVKKYQSNLKYTVLAAKVNNIIKELNKTIEEPCTVKFLDIRNLSANFIYQRSVFLVYLKAIQDVLGDVRVNINNSLNKGVYTVIRTKDQLSDEDIALIEKRMREIVDEDIPIVKKRLPAKEIVELLSDGRHEQKLHMMKRSPHITELPLYDCGGYSNFFYGQMLPSTGLINLFELRRYRNGILVRFPSPDSPDRIPDFRDDKKLYVVFGEAKKRGNLMGVNYVGDLNRALETNRYKDLILMAEAFQEKFIAQIADEITETKKRIILISGPSSSGKTTFAKRLCVQLMVNGLNPVYLGTDDYFVEREETPLLPNGEYNFEDLEAIDINLFNRNMNDLLSGIEVDLPRFDFKNGTKIFGERIMKVEQQQPIVIEGIHGLNEDLTPDIPLETKFKIYISPLTQLNIDEHTRIPLTDVRFLRRIVRDNMFRHYTADMTIMQWPKVRAAEDKNVFSYNGFADAIFNSSFVYELAIMKSHAQPLLDAIDEDNPAYSESIRLNNFLRFFLPMEDESFIPNNSIMREFIGGSIFVD